MSIFMLGLLTSGPTEFPKRLLFQLSVKSCDRTSEGSGKDSGKPILNVNEYSSAAATLTD